MQLYRNFPGESTIFMNLDKNFEETLYLIFDYPYKYYTFKLFEV